MRPYAYFNYNYYNKTCLERKNQILMVMDVSVF